MLNAVSGELPAAPMLQSKHKGSLDCVIARFADDDSAQDDKPSGSQLGADLP
jgi:hypothetical protein